jgi:hypothetical protein
MRIKDPVDELSAQGFIEGYYGEVWPENHSKAGQKVWPNRADRVVTYANTPAMTQPAFYWILMKGNIPLASQGMMEFSSHYFGAGLRAMVEGKGYGKKIATHVIEKFVNKPTLIFADNEGLWPMWKALGFRQIQEVPKDADESIQQISEAILDRKPTKLFLRDSGELNKSFDYIWEFTIKKGGY